MRIDSLTPKTLWRRSIGFTRRQSRNFKVLLVRRHRSAAPAAAAGVDLLLRLPLQASIRETLHLDQVAGAGTDTLGCE